MESPPGTVPDAVRAETLYAIGMLFWMGQGVQQDSYEAASWLHLAAEMNHPGAQNKLGFLYSSGQGVQAKRFRGLQVVADWQPTRAMQMPSTTWAWCTGTAWV